nr:uncharacterized protein LOC117279853 [Nicotiana tomentosiformis]
MKGVVEAANKNIKKILRNMIDNYKHWQEKLPFALLRYRTTVRTSTRETPYLLVYGTEVVIPAEVEIPSLLIIQESELSDAEWAKRGPLTHIRLRTAFLRLHEDKALSPFLHKAKPCLRHLHMAKHCLSSLSNNQIPLHPCISWAERLPHYPKAS